MRCEDRCRYPTGPCEDLDRGAPTNTRVAHMQADADVEADRETDADADASASTANIFRSVREPTLLWILNQVASRLAKSTSYTKTSICSRGDKQEACKTGSEHRRNYELKDTATHVSQSPPLTPESEPRICGPHVCGTGRRIHALGQRQEGLQRAMSRILHARWNHR